MAERVFDPRTPLSGPDGVACPHCGKEEGFLFGYGLACGSIGSYLICEACQRFCNFKMDESSELTIE